MLNKNLYIFSLLTLFLGCGQKQFDYEKVASYQDTSIKQLSVPANINTRVLLVFPHADDEIICAGLVSHLKEKGAIIHLLTLGHGPEAENNEIRIDELHCATEKMGIEKVEIVGLTTNNWDDVMNDNIKFWYDNKDSIKAIIKNKIDIFEPQVLITYDTEIGGYGHPEHRISAELTEEIFNDNKSDSLFVPQQIYQFTLPDKLEEFMVSHVPTYDFSRKATGSDGLPNPDVALNIIQYWHIKNEVARCHESQFKTLNKFYMIASNENLEAHSKAFNTEYYTVVQ